uniref:GPI mannosyltransferase 2 n=1 Tax=Corethron hystrix TaxID=216773 RepID=A0A7S1G1U3_9STRA
MHIDPGDDVLQYPLGQRTVSSTLLEPFTRWDAARLLSIAHNGREGDATYSEQSHAFLPLYPMAVRASRLGLLSFFPNMDVKEAAVLGGLILSVISFVLATGALYDMTLTISSVYRPTDAAVMAKNVSFLFIFNPSNVFFTSVYTESMFSFLTFCGYAFWARAVLTCDNQLDRLRLQLPAVFCWISASYTRSNGTAVAVFILLSLIGSIAGTLRGLLNQGNSSRIRALIHIIFTSLWYVGMAILVSLPLAYHDHTGYLLHCSKYTQTCQDSGPNVCSNFQQSNPSWCQGSREKWYWPLPQPLPFYLIFPVKEKFSLYSYVQRKYWNVGPFQYYELKQIPNFFLAFPVLAIGFCASWCWCALSIRRWKLRQSNERYSLWRHWYSWIFYALECSSCVASSSRSNHGYSSDDGAEYFSYLNIVQDIYFCPYISPYMLGHYAVLFATCLVGALVSNVQITTRLVCSSCPAFYWFLAACLTNWFKKRGNNQAFIFKNDERSLPQTFLWVYLVTFNILGCIMYVNWLPWT